jgi:hypothetical protein
MEITRAAATTAASGKRPQRGILVTATGTAAPTAEIAAAPGMAAAAVTPAPRVGVAAHGTAAVVAGETRAGVAEAVPAEAAVHAPPVGSRPVARTGRLHLN